MFGKTSFITHFVTPNLFRGLLSIFFLTISLALIGCHSTKLNERTQFLADGLEVNASDEIFKLYDTDFEKNLKPNEKFIFLRLYFPNYDNKLSGVNILKKLIASVDPTNEQISHTSIGFSLDDEFYGLTRYKPQDLKFESCLNTETNKYMKMCNKYTSIQMTLAIKVSDEEYQATKEFLEKDYEKGTVRYHIPKNLSIGFWCVKRKKQKTPQEKILGGFPSKNGYVDPTTENKQKFVCSSYIAYVLSSTVKNINDFFIEKQIDYNYVIPTDLIFIPGAKKLFVSTWADYAIATEEFIKSEPIFAEYYSK